MPDAPLLRSGKRSRVDNTGLSGIPYLILGLLLKGSVPFVHGLPQSALRCMPKKGKRLVGGP